MSDKPVVSPENVPTLAAVALILGLLSLVYGFYLHRQVNIAAVGGVALDVRAAQRDQGFTKEIEDLKGRIAKLEAAQTTGASTTPAVPVATDGAAPPAEGAAK